MYRVIPRLNFRAEKIGQRRLPDYISLMAGLTIWCNATLGEPALKLLRAEIAPHRLVFSSTPAASVLDAGRPDTTLASADVAFGQPDPDSLIQAQRVRWVHITSAGFTRYDRDDLRLALRRRGGLLTNSSHVFDEPCAQHALAMILALERQLPRALINQRGDRAWPMTELRAGSRLLNGPCLVRNSTISRATNWLRPET